MAWKVDLTPTALKQLAKLDKPVATRILGFLRERVEKLDDPRQVGARLQGAWSGLWKYRVGDYRIICSIESARLVVLVLRVGHRREIYKR